MIKWYTNRGWIFWLAIILIIILIIWLFFGGQTYEFVGIKPLEPGTIYREKMDPWTRSNIRISQFGSNYRHHEQPIRQAEPVRTPVISEVQSVATNTTPYVIVNDISYVNVNPLPKLNVKSVRNNSPDQAGDELIIEHKHNLISDFMIPDHIKQLSANRPNQKKKSRKGYKKRYKNESIGETISRGVLEKFYPGYSFDRIRPKWLKNPKTGRCMELDGYCEELKIGFEYNGEQHYTYRNSFHKSEKQFLDQVERDMVKLDICDSLGVYVITIPYTVPHNVIKEFIQYYLPETVIKRQQEANM